MGCTVGEGGIEVNGYVNYIMLIPSHLSQYSICSFAIGQRQIKIMNWVGIFNFNSINNSKPN